MSIDALILNSGEWLLSQELPAAPWHVLIYTQRGSPDNELHVWLPRRESARHDRYAFKRYWEENSTRWCVEIQEATSGGHGRPGGRRVRFSAPDGRVLWAESPGGHGLGDLSHAQLTTLLKGAQRSSFYSAADSPHPAS